MPVINAGGGCRNLGGGGGDSPGEPSLCAGCGSKIVDRYYLLAVDRQWHSQCLKCCECKLRLDSELTCFARDGNIYCKDDYYRFFAVKRCARCHLGISANELVMRARDFVYHLHCFSCASCNKALTKGEQFGMKENMVYCRHHYESLHVHHHHLVGDYTTNAVGGAAAAAAVAAAAAEEDASSPTALFVRTPPPPGHHHHHHHHHHQGAARMPYYNGVGTVQKGRPRKKKVMDNQPEVHTITGLGPGQTLDLLGSGGGELCNLEAGGGSAYDTNPSTPNSSNTGGQSQARTKRMRTSFKHHQLRTMKSYFALNQNPDAKDLKQLAQKTGLSKRVLQVWFQNARAKWRRNMIRQEGQLGDKGPSSVDPTNCSSTVNDLVSGVGGGVGGLGAPLSTTPSSMGDISGGTLTSDSQSPPSLTFGDLY